MLQTNSALASGGMHHCSLRCGFSSFFQSPPHGLVGDRGDDLQLDQPVGEHLHGPLLAAFGRGGAGQGDEPGLGPAVERPLSTGPVLGLADQGGLQALLDEPLADPSDGIGADLEGLGDPDIGPGRAALGGVRLEQDAGVGQFLGGGLAVGDQALQELTFLGAERNPVLRHNYPPEATIASGE
jgi:hypothetical protein